MVVNPVDQYAQDVVAGRLPAGKYHRLACQRHLNDRARAVSPAFPFTFSWAMAERFLKFAGLMKHYKGRQFANTPFTPTPCQVFRLGSIFGWRHAKTGLRRFTTAYNEVPRKQGKAMALDTPVPTPDGWKRHGDLRVGDRVFGPDGRPKRVEWVGPIQQGPCYRLTVSTGESFVAHAHHEWVTERTWYTGRRRGSRAPLPPVETQQIARTLRAGARGDFVHRIAVAAALELPAVDLPIPPYTLGVWLGDGTAVTGAVTIADQDRAIVSRMEAEGVSCREVRQSRGASLFRLDGRQGSPASFTSRLRALGVLNDKRIPPIYLRASRAQRLELLRGLIDTDGHLGARGVYELVSVSRPLADDVRELLHTLGLKSTLVEDRARLDGVDHGPRYRLAFSIDEDQVAHLTRKQSTWIPSRRRRSRGRTVVGCDPCDAVPTQCIQVEGGLYLVGRDFVVTHNSFEEAVVSVYCTFFEGEAGAEGYCIATKEKQAKIAFDAAKKLVKSSGLSQRIKINAANLHRVESESKLEPLGSDSDTTDGLNPHFVGVDELHAFKNRGLLDVMESATGARLNPLIFQITTAGDDPVSVCGDQHDYACKILDGVLEDDASTLSFFAFIAHADEGDDPWSEETWKKANPHYGISVNPEDMRKLAAKAQKMPSAAAEFKQKRLNLWVNATAPCLSVDGWRAGQSATSQEAFEAALEHESCYVGIDLASKIDLCVVSAVFPPTPGRPKFHVIQRIWTPADTLKDRAHRDRAPYDVWVQQGRLITTPGTRIDHRVVREALGWLRDRYDIERIGFDPWHADQLIDQLAKDDGFGEECVLAVPQTYQGMSSACLRFQAEVLDANVDTGGCPVTAWAAANTVGQRDGKDNLMFAKGRSRGRIDPIIAPTIALSLWLREPAPRPAEMRIEVW